MQAHERRTSNGRTRDEGIVPVLQARAGGPAERFAGHGHVLRICRDYVGLDVGDFGGARAGSKK